MTIDSALELIETYGAVILFVLSFLEAMNCPGMPAGILLPAGGLVAAGSVGRLTEVYLFMFAGAMLGCMVLYGVGRLGGKALEHWLKKHSGKRREKIEHHLERLKRGNWVTVFVCRLIPVVRTLGSVLAGISEMPVCAYVTGTAAGVAVYNAVGVGLGFFAGWMFR